MSQSTPVTSSCSAVNITPSRASCSRVAFTTPRSSAQKSSERYSFYVAYSFRLVDEDFVFYVTQCLAVGSLAGHTYSHAYGTEMSLSVCNACIVAKRYVLLENCLKKQIGSPVPYPFLLKVTICIGYMFVFIVNYCNFSWSSAILIGNIYVSAAAMFWSKYG